jgi:hypothetical protein
MRKLSLYVVCLFTVAASIVFLGGIFAPPKAPGIYVAEGHDKYIMDMSPRDVLAVIDGEAVRKADYTLLQSLQERLFRMSHGFPLYGRNEKAEHYSYANEQRILQMLLKRVTVRQCAKRDGVMVSEEELAREWEKHSRRLRRVGVPFEKVQAELDSKEGQLLGELLRDSVLEGKLLASAFTNDFAKVTPQEVTNRMEWVERFNKAADTFNEGVKETLRKARSEIIGGEKFAAVAKKYSEIRPAEGREWKDVQLGELPDDRDGTKNPLRIWLENANPGDISEPMDMDDGISIVGFVGTFEGDAPPGEQKPTVYRLVRCTRFAHEHSMYQSPDETEAQLRKWKLEDARTSFGARLEKSLVLEYPNGTNFYPSAEESLKRWQKELDKRR